MLGWGYSTLFCCIRIFQSINLMAKLSEGDDVLSSVADLKLVELVLEGLHDGRSVADRVNQNDTETSKKMQVIQLMGRV